MTCPKCSIPPLSDMVLQSALRSMQMSYDPDRMEPWDVERFIAEVRKLRDLAEELVASCSGLFIQSGHRDQTTVDRAAFDALCKALPPQERA